MRQMTRDEWQHFLMERARTGKLAIVRPDGRPHVTPIWFTLDGDELVFNTGADSVKGRALRQNPRAAICVDDDRPPFDFVTIEGAVELSDDLNAVRHWAGVIGGRYMGAERTEEFAQRNGVPGELLVRLRPEKVIAMKGVAD